jgi:hypothetical protein
LLVDAADAVVGEKMWLQGKETNDTHTDRPISTKVVSNNTLHAGSNLIRYKTLPAK